MQRQSLKHTARKGHHIKLEKIVFVTTCMSHVMKFAVLHAGLSKDDLLEIFEKILIITAELLEECVKKAKDQVRSCAAVQAAHTPPHAPHTHHIAQHVTWRKVRYCNKVGQRNSSKERWARWEMSCVHTKLHLGVFSICFCVLLLFISSGLFLFVLGQRC